MARQIQNGNIIKVVEDSASLGHTDVDMTLASAITSNQAGDIVAIQRSDGSVVYMTVADLLAGAEGGSGTVNLIKNSNGKYPLAPAGTDLATGVAVAGSYVGDSPIDGWSMTHSLTTVTVKQESGLRFTATTKGAGTQLYVIQAIPDIEKFAGQQVTLSVRLKSNISTMRLRYYDGTNTEYTNVHGGGGSFATLSATFTVASSPDPDASEIRFFASAIASDGDYFEYEWVQLTPSESVESYVPETDNINRLRTYGVTAFGINPNLLINADGTDPVNQRGVADGDPVASTAYFLDRWYASHDCTTVDVKLTASTGFGLTCDTIGAGTNMQMIQKVENYAYLAGKTVTLSASVKSNGDARLFMSDGVGVSNYSTAHTGGGSYETLTLSYTVNASPTRFDARVLIDSTLANSEYLEIAWAKLEVGSGATPFVADLPNVNLAKCQRYHQRWDTDGTTGSALVGIGYGQGTTQIVGTAELNTAMRALPTISHSTLTGNLFICIGAGSPVYGTAIAASQAYSTYDKDGSCIKVGMSITTSGATVNEAYVSRFNGSTSGYIEFDAEL
jgi:hypothetical protein